MAVESVLSWDKIGLNAEFHIELQTAIDTIESNEILKDRVWDQTKLRRGSVVLFCRIFGAN